MLYLMNNNLFFQYSDLVFPVNNQSQELGRLEMAVYTKFIFCQQSSFYVCLYVWTSVYKAFPN
jgi:hypothetical protein